MQAIALAMSCRMAKTFAWTPAKKMLPGYLAVAGLSAETAVLKLSRRMPWMNSIITSCEVCISKK